MTKQEVILEKRKVYKDYTFYIHPTWTLFGMKICFVKRNGLTIDKTTGFTDDEAVEMAKKKIDFWLGE